MPAGAQGETASGRQGEIVDNAGDKTERARGEPLLDRPQRFLAPPGLDQDHLPGVDAEAREPWRIKLAQFTAGMARRAPQKCGGSTSGLDGGEAAARQEQHEGESGPTIRRMATVP